MKGYEDQKTGKTNQNCLVIIISKMKIKSLHRKESDCDDSHICRHICIYLFIFTLEISMSFKTVKSDFKVLITSEYGDHSTVWIFCFWMGQHRIHSYCNKLFYMYDSIFLSLFISAQSFVSLLLVPNWLLWFSFKLKGSQLTIILFCFILVTF